MVVGNKAGGERRKAKDARGRSAGPPIINQPGLCPVGHEAPMMTFKPMSDTTTLTF